MAQHAGPGPPLAAMRRWISSMLADSTSAITVARMASNSSSTTDRRPALSIVRSGGVEEPVERPRVEHVALTDRAWSFVLGEHLAVDVVECRGHRTT